ncbi:protein kinase [Streptosporangium sp. NPDC051022]|uniref:serine/threonine-protein kinase n=1 Tax=Streptosporangium sp. NPDC051022 TaxID=3155752 RepID=UPI00342B9B54
MNQDDRLGPYRLLRRLGEGGMGVVHLAVDPHGRQVAVKVLRSEVTGDDVARRRLSREVETMRRVRSEHIAEVLDADVTGHRPYIVTRYVPGQPLDEHVKQEGPMDLPALLKVAHGVAAALAAVHSVGVIHRDLKPGNVLILDGRPVLIDFGIAQAVDATRLTQTGMFIGTPGYLAPEIIEGHEAGPEVDVHAWAGTLVFAATGQPPFGKGTLEMIFYNITAGKANVDAVPQPLQSLLRGALHRDPARRPRAAELTAQLERLLPLAGRRPQVPDEIATVSGFDDPGSARPTGGNPGPATGAGLPTGHYVPTGLGPRPGQDVPARSADPGPPTGHYVPTGLGPRPGQDVPARFADPGPPTGPYVPTGLGVQPGQGSGVPGRSGEHGGPGVHGGSTGPGAPGRPGVPGDPGDLPTPVAIRPGTSAPWPPAQTPQTHDYVSLLGEQQAPDPWPTRRVTADELRQAAAAQQASYDLPTGALGPQDAPTRSLSTGPGAFAGPGGHAGSPGSPGSQGSPGFPGSQGSSGFPGSQGSPGSTGERPPQDAQGRFGTTLPAADGDIPTQRVRPQDLQEYIRNAPQPPATGSARPYPAQPASFEQTPQVRQHHVPSHPYSPSQPQPYQERPHQQAAVSPGSPGSPVSSGSSASSASSSSGRRHGHALQRSKAYGVASALLMIAVSVAAVLAPVLVAAVVIPAVILLRAADIAQLQLNGRRSAEDSAADVFRVLGQPAALLKSVGVTLALVPYGLILGLPVTLLLTVLVPRMTAGNALSWGAAVALWTVCSGPGVEGPNRQMRRTLASLLPSRGAAVIAASAMGVAVALMVFLAAGTVGARARQAHWTPINIQTVVGELDKLQLKAAR